MAREHPARLILTAVHEASHAVIAYELGIEYDRVSIIHEPSRGHLGCCEGPRWRGSGEIVDDCPEVEIALAITLGGAVGVQLLTGRESDEGMSTDIEKAWILARLLDPQEPERPLRAAWDRAVAILTERWPAVQALAQALLADREVMLQALREIIETANQRVNTS
jgi:hypothetical protein